MDDYEKWYAKEDKRDPKYNLNFVGVVSGYLLGYTATVTLNLYACSLEEAKRMFDAAIEKAGIVNLSDYHVARSDA